MNVLVLMAGRDDAFREAGYLYPKNLTEIAGRPLVEHVTEALQPLRKVGAQFHFLVRADENRRFHTGDVLKLLVPDATILEVHEPTAGAACTALLAIEHIASETPLLICNGDQVIHADLPAMIDDFTARRLDGGIAVFEAVHPRWSYVRLDAGELVVETAEKRPISKNATAGLYWFAQGSEFVQAAMAMIKKDAHVEGVFYLCPAYNELILRQKRIGIHRIERSTYRSLASPRNITEYEDWLKHA
jgi:dTDP-glucose pyrophosphorylase